MRQLLEDYKRRLVTAEEMLKTTKDSGSRNDIAKMERLKTKAAAYRTFISEMEKVLAGEPSVEENWLDVTKSQLGWIEKRVPLDMMQREYVGFILNEQAKFVCLLSGHIYAARGSVCINDTKQVEFFLDAAIQDIESPVLDRRISDVPKQEEKDRKQCVHYDEAQGRHFCLNTRIMSKTCVELCAAFKPKST